MNGCQPVILEADDIRLSHSASIVVPYEFPELPERGRV
jgi:hypothetical protein